MKTVNFIKQTAAAVVIAVIFFAGCKKDDPVKVTGVSLDKAALTIVAGEEAALVATVTPADATNKGVTWSVNPFDVAIIGDKGEVIAMKPGTATITVTTDDGGFTDNCVVTVTAEIVAVTGVTLNKHELPLTVGGSETLTATIAPADATNKEVTWSIDPLDVAIIGDNGEVIAMKPGTATITVTTDDGSFTDKCAVTVNEPAITMTAAKEGELSFFLAGAGEAVIYWGDDSEPETVTLSAYTDGFTNPQQVTHSFSLAGPHSIAIDGQNITHLRCQNMELTAIDVSKNTGLEYLDCSYNRLTSIDVSKNSALTELTCRNNQLASIDVNNNTALTYLSCSGNQLTSIDISNNTALIYLNCTTNQLTSIDINNNTVLTYLTCEGNRLASIDVSNNTALTELSCSNNQLASIDVSNNTALIQLYCSSNQLTSLDVSKNIALTELWCHMNQLTTLDVSKNTALIRIDCPTNQLTSIDISNNIALTRLDCQENQLTSIDVSKNAALKELLITRNQFTSLDLSNNAAMTRLLCASNQLEAEELDDLFSTLHSNAGYKTIYINGNPGTDVCDRTIATDKGWMIY